MANDFVTNVGNGFLASGNRSKLLLTLITGSSTATSLAGLTTADKTSIVGALNALQSAVNAAAQSGGAAINDAAAGTSTTYSSSKVAELLAQAKSDILNGAPAALDTLKEFADALGNDSNFAATITTALGNRLRFDAAQTLTAAQKTQALANLGAQDKASIGDTSTDFAAIFTTAATS